MEGAEEEAAARFCSNQVMSNIQDQKSPQTLFLVILTVVHGIFVALFSIFVRYDSISATANYAKEDEGSRKEALHKLEGQYPSNYD